MSFKRRLTSFIGKKDSKADSDINTRDLSFGPAVAKYKHVDELPSDPQRDRETMESIEQVYFEGDIFDASKYELQKLPAKLVLQDIDDDRNKLRKQLQAVCKKVSDVVLENHPSYAAELQRVMELQKTLQKANTICTQGRKQLTEAKQGFTTISLGLLSNYRKRQQLLALLKSLRTIKTLQRTDIRLREMLEEEDYPGAIQLCLECQKAASTFRHYHCISELSSKLQDTLEMIEEQLDVALSKTCSRFEQKHYEKVQAAYTLLSKIQTAMDQLHMHYASAIHNTAFNIVLGYAELYTGTASSHFQKKQYGDLCNALWEVMKSYHQTMQWHGKHDQEVHEFESSPRDRVAFNKNYVKQKLDHGLGRIWQDVQQKIKKYILSTDLASFKYDEFIQVLDIVNRLIQIGEEFCGSKSETLHDSIHTQTVKYFRNFHRAKLEELKVFLENEGWELCPVKNNFEINQLHEFKFLRKARRQHPFNPDTTSLTSTSSSSKGFFVKYASQGSPFDLQVEEEEREDVLDVNGYTGGSDSDSDVPDELKQDFIDEQTGETPIHRTNFKGSRRNIEKRAPIITNTTLNVIRLFGKYMQTMNVLKPIAFDVILCMSQLFDFYLYAVYVFFGSEAMNESTLSNKLNTTLKRIKDSLIADNSDGSRTASVITDGLDKIPQPFLSPVVDLHDPGTLCGLTEKIVAVESLVFLAKQFDLLQPYLESAIPSAKIAFLQQFYSQTICTAHELRHPIYRNAGTASIDYSYILNQMGSVKWDIKDIMSQHSPYVDTVLYEFETFSCRLQEVNHRVPIPKPVYDIIWDHCVTLANKQFVEGYGLVKKCSNEGRALMQLDFQQFLTKLEKLTEIRPIPGREFVEVYIKAYYLPDDQLEIWIRDHKEYSNKQIMSLLHCVPHINRKTRQKLVAMLEDNVIRK